MKRSLITPRTGRFAVPRAGNQRIGPAIQKAPTASHEYRLLLLVADEQLSYEEAATLTDQTPDAGAGNCIARKAFAVLFQKSVEL
jgi:hypothetical protein